MDFLKDNKVFIVAELSANHAGKIENAIETIKAAKEVGADAIKLQTYTPDTMTIVSNKEDFIVKGGSLWAGQTLHDLYKTAYTPWEWHKKLYEFSREQGLICFSTPFDISSVDFLEELINPIIKIASFEIQDIPLIKYAASKGKPMILSTGIATDEDIKLAIDTCKGEGNEKIILLKCTSAYPAPIEESNLVMINDFANRFGVVPGLSDHTMGITVPVAATVLGARVIEKHFILDKSIGGPDAPFSLDKKEFKEMVDAVREAEKSIGKINYTLSQKQEKGKQFARSLYVVEDIKEGELLTEKNIRSIRPGYGMHPKFYWEVLGKKAKVDIERGTPLNKEHFE
jgi:pseudaminic acid synthase